MMQDVLDLLNIDQDTANKVRMAVTCLLHNEGGWWDTGCIVNHITRVWSIEPGPLTDLLVGAALTELVVEERRAVRQVTDGRMLFSIVR